MPWETPFRAGGRPQAFGLEGGAVTHPLRDGTPWLSKEKWSGWAARAVRGDGGRMAFATGTASASPLS